MALTTAWNNIGICGSMAVMAFYTGDFCPVGLAAGGDILGRFFVTFNTVVRGKACGAGRGGAGKKCQNEWACHQQAGQFQISVFLLHCFPSSDEKIYRKLNMSGFMSFGCKYMFYAVEVIQR